MGVVRREGQWRLEKLEDGYYEVTYEQETQSIVLTPDYKPGMMDDASFSTVPVHEVDSYKEAEGIFEEHAHGTQQAGMSAFGGGDLLSSASGGSQSGGINLGLDSQNSSQPVLSEPQEGDHGNLEDLPPGGFALVLLLAGLVAIWVAGFAPGEPVFLIGAGLFGAGLLIFGWAGYLLRTKGLSDATDFLLTVDEEESTSSSGISTDSNEPDKTPPLSENQKNDLIFGRANQECEWCGSHLDNPEVHHIEPRSEGGPNEPDNLIVLCPTCHRKADRGGISQNKLRGKLAHIETS